MEVFIGFWWFIGCLAVGQAAGKRGRSEIGYFLWALILSPVFAIFLVIAAPTREAETRERRPNEPREWVKTITGRRLEGERYAARIDPTL